ncbi:MAG: hypothetical protein JOY64_18790 [Alphaproteobacteria bacterium]|nr:hypothetical protein [Alphaproteobacteria bacterium]
MTPDSGDGNFGVVPIEQARRMDGISLWRGLLEGRVPAPPIAKALGFKVAEVDLGRLIAHGTTTCLIFAL